MTTEDESWEALEAAQSRKNPLPSRIFRPTYWQDIACTIPAVAEGDKVACVRYFTLSESGHINSEVFDMIQSNPERRPAFSLVKSAESSNTRLLIDTFKEKK